MVPVESFECFSDLTGKSSSTGPLLENVFEVRLFLSEMRFFPPSEVG